MSQKRKDNKGRILRNGENQRKDGKYEYKYTGADGIRHSIYSWKLVDTDKVPEGKHCKECLRDIEKRLTRDAEDGINSYQSAHTTLDKMFAIYIDNKKDLKQRTLEQYKYLYRKFVSNAIGFQSITEIKYSTIKKFYLSLIFDKGFKQGSTKAIHLILHSVFKLAVRDGYIRINPTDGVMTEIKSSYAERSQKRHALTEPQQAAFVDFISNSNTYKRWQNLFTVLLGTGCRIGEIIGLRWQDCNFKDNMITINHNLVYFSADGNKSSFKVSTPKTEAGVRVIPMLDDVRKALLQEKEFQSNANLNPIAIDGYSGFIFTNGAGHVHLPGTINRVISNICKSYNASEQILAQKQHREALLLPHFSVHNLRHTFCTRFCENETNLKIIQEIMGHANIETTMNIYNEATKERKVKSFENLEGKMKLR